MPILTEPKSMKILSRGHVWNLISAARATYFVGFLLHIGALEELSNLLLELTLEVPREELAAGSTARSRIRQYNCVGYRNSQQPHRFLVMQARFARHWSSTLRCIGSHRRIDTAPNNFWRVPPTLHISHFTYSSSHHVCTWLVHSAYLIYRYVRFIKAYKALTL